MGSPSDSVEGGTYLAIPSVNDEQYQDWDHRAARGW
jgi:hypothetical protein